MVSSVCLNRSQNDMYFANQDASSSNVLINLPRNIDIFSELSSVDDNDVNENTRKSYYKLLSTLKSNLNGIDRLSILKNNFSKMRNYVDEDKEISIEWIIRNNYRIGFFIDKDGIISFWKIYKNNSTTNTVSDILDDTNFEERISDIIDEVICLTWVILKTYIQSHSTEG